MVHGVALLCLRERSARKLSPDAPPCPLRGNRLMGLPFIRMAAITITITILIAVTYFLTHYHH